MYFSKNIPGITPVVMNYKVRHNKNWLVRYRVTTFASQNDVKWCHHNFGGAIDLS